METFQQVPLRFSKYAAVVLCALLAACGGGGGGGSSALPSTPTAAMPGPGTVTTASLTQPTITNPVPISTNGTVSGTFGNGFVLQTTTHGLIDVFTSSATITGPAPFVGENVSVNGSGSWSQAIIATSVAQITTNTTIVAPTASPVAAPTASPSVIGVPQGIVSTQGTIVGTRNGGYTVQTGYPHYLVPVYTNASTTNIGTPAVNAYVMISGTGSLSSSVTATSLTVEASAPSSITLTGTIAAATSYGFTLNVDSTHPAVPIVLNSSVVVGGGPLQIGAIAKVLGPGTETTSVTPVQIVVTLPTPPPAPMSTPTPTPGPISQTHVLSGDYLGSPYGSTTVSYATAAQYLNWAEVSASVANSASAVGIKTEFYINPNRIQTNDAMYTSNESTFAHDCSGNRVSTVYNNYVTQYVGDVTNSATQSLYASVVAQKTSGVHYDALFEDDAGALSAYTGLSATPCNYTDAAWINGEEALEASPAIPTIFNGLSGLNGHGVSLSMQLLSKSAAIGGTFEHCYTDDTTPESSGWLWTATENTELQVASQHKLFQCMARNTSSASTQIAARIYAYASFLMSYDPSTSLYWNYFATPSNLRFMPEEQLVVTNPVVAAPSDISGLMTSGGAYGREYRNCYIAGNFVGPCAVAVNPDSGATHAFPFPQYTHTLVLNGAGLLDGGTMATNGPSAPTYMPTNSAYIVFP